MVVVLVVMYVCRVSNPRRQRTARETHVLVQSTNHADTGYALLPLFCRRRSNDHSMQNKSYDLRL